MNWAKHNPCKAYGTSENPKANHTEGQLFVAVNNEFLIVAKDGREVAWTDNAVATFELPEAVAIANACEIVKRWNCHEDLLAMLSMVLDSNIADVSIRMVVRGKVLAAIAKAESTE
jgi:hypothetical protein